jgi:class 3 adenylate cyclase
MKILNAFFCQLDEIIHSFPTMTKIKCIGDCYMASGSIFTEQNQPVTHATEAINFGLKAIECLKQINKKMNQNLQIRVGINTGGPIVGGIMGTSKPVFEILGSTINIAQQLEHQGISMNVHISRAVYELIFGGGFKMSERNQTNIKQGTIVTYLIN